MSIAKYLIEPKSNLIEAMKEHPEKSLTNPVIWEIDEHPHALPIHHETLYAPSIKLVFLASIDDMMKVLANDKKLKNIVTKLFGDPPQFSIFNFDKWWTIRRIPSSRSYPHALLGVHAESFRSLQKGEDDLINELIDSLVALKTLYDSLDKNSEKRKELKKAILGSFDE